MINNPTGCSMALEGGSLLGEATPVTLVNHAPNGNQTQGIPEEMSALRWIQTKPTAWRQQKLLESIGTLETLTPAQQQKLTDFLKEHNTAFALEEGERGETDLVEMHINTGDAAPQRCPPRWMPLEVAPLAVQSRDFAVEQERDSRLKEIIDFLEQGDLPAEENTAI